MVVDSLYCTCSVSGVGFPSAPSDRPPISFPPPSSFSFSSSSCCCCSCFPSMSSSAPSPSPSSSPPESVSQVESQSSTVVGSLKLTPFSRFPIGTAGVCSSGLVGSPWALCC
ncbi:hypothetical protein FKM82_015343 [Ascaphus truei]